MSTNSARVGAPRRVHVEGELTIYRVAEVRAALIEALSDGVDVETDLSQVTEMDGPGLQLLAAAKQEASAGGHAFSIVSPSAAAERVLQLSGLAEWFAEVSAAPAFGEEGKHSQDEVDTHGNSARAGKADVHTGEPGTAPGDGKRAAARRGGGKRRRVD